MKGARDRDRTGEREARRKQRGREEKRRQRGRAKKRRRNRSVCEREERGIRNTRGYANCVKMCELKMKGRVKSHGRDGKVLTDRKERG